MADSTPANAHDDVKNALAKAERAAITDLRHDVKDQLNNIIGLARLMSRMSAEGQYDQAEYLEMLVASAYEINALVESTRALTDAQPGVSAID